MQCSKFQILLNSISSFYVKSRQLIFGSEFNQIFREKTTSQNLIKKIKRDKVRTRKNERNLRRYHSHFAVYCRYAFCHNCNVDSLGWSFGRRRNSFHCTWRCLHNFWYNLSCHLYRHPAHPGSSGLIGILLISSQIGIRKRLDLWIRIS